MTQSWPRPVQASFLGLAMLMTTGCATLAHGRHQDMVIQSDPPGALLHVNGTPSGVTPATVQLRRSRPAVLRLEREGFQPVEVRIRRKPSRWLWEGAICFNPLAGQGLDSASQWPVFIVGCLAELVGVDLLLGGAFVFSPVPTIALTPAIDAPEPTGGKGFDGRAPSPSSEVPGDSDAYRSAGLH